MQFRTSCYRIGQVTVQSWDHSSCGKWESVFLQRRVLPWQEEKWWEHLMIITHINTQTLQQDTWSAEMCCLQDAALHGIRTAKKQQIEQRETISMWKWRSSCFVLVLVFASVLGCKKTDINSYMAKYSQQSILCGLSPSSWGRINLKGAFLLSWLANSWSDKKPVVVLKAHKSISEAS